MGKFKKTNNKWLDINNDKDIDISKLTNFKQLNSTTDAEACYIYKSGKLVKTVCKSTQSVLCVKNSTSDNKNELIISR